MTQSASPSRQPSIDQLLDQLDRLVALLAGIETSLTVLSITLGEAIRPDLFPHDEPLPPDPDLLALLMAASEAQEP